MQVLENNYLDSTVDFVRGDNHLRILIDWCQLTVKNMSIERLCSKLLKIPLEFFKSDDTTGIAGYKPFLYYGNIRILEPSGQNTLEKSGYQVLMSGQGCRDYEMFLFANNESWYDLLERAIEYDCNIPRIDIAIDDFKTYFKIDTLIRFFNKGWVSTRIISFNEHGGKKIKSGESTGKTLSIGSSQSLLFMTFYEKKFERINKGVYVSDEIENWNRYELKFRQEKAVATAKALISTHDIANVTLGILKESLRFVIPPKNSSDTDKRRWQTWQPWAYFLDDIEPIKLSIEKTDKTFEKLASWLMISCAPSLWIYKTVHERFYGTEIDPISELIERANINKHHIRLVDEFLTELERDKVISECFN